MKIVYLTWGETPRSYGVFGSQVVGQFVETHRCMPNDEFYFISAVPVVHSGLIREKWKYGQELENIRQKLDGIKFLWIPIYATQNFINSTKTTFNFIHMGAKWHLKNKLRKLQPDIVHCRSYHAAWAALQARRRHGFAYKIVFDGRGLWPEEIALKRGILENDEDYLYLKSIEEELLLNCEASIGVSDTMKLYYESLGAKNVKCVYLSASTKKLSPKEVESKEDDCVITFCYVGALSDDTWHKPKQLLELYRHLRSTLDSTKLTIVTTSNHSAIRECFGDIPKEELFITSTKTVEELKEVLIGVDFGLMSYFIPSSEREILLGKMVLAVKTAEYLAAGLPIIINQYCGGASNVVGNYGVGIVYNPHTFEELNEENIQALCNVSMKSKTSLLAKELFDYSSNGVRYAEIYNDLAKE